MKNEYQLTSLNQNGQLYESVWNNYTTGRYKYAGYEIFLDLDVYHIDLEYLTILDLVKEIGAIEHGLFFTFGLIMGGYATFYLDEKLASTFLLERDSDLPAGIS